MASPVDFGVTRHQDDERLRLERWRRNVGAPVALDLTTAPASGNGPTARSLVVLSWNVWIGRGRLLDLVSRIRSGDFAAQGAEPDAPLVVLAQEVYRRDPTIPLDSTGRAGRMLVAQLGQQEDIVETARALGMNLRYAPSMRNGAMQSDRGNAILSTLPLEDAEALELPLVLQRRVAVSARVRVGGLTLRVVSAHLDPRGPPGHRWLGAAGRALQAQHLLSSLRDDTVILGADLNLGRGRYERAWRVLRDAGFSFGIPPSSPPWRHTFHALPRLVLDYLLVRDPSGAVERARVHRLDEHPRDRGPLVFGSDHHPLLARIDLASP
ncbi:MAG TPA: endonuclease/exonuclease/phosphatase family protein [Gemmatimonadales bacterium]|nr:endonuclease/exonuclease/phosphatase family protein [Gemmatimonadales bacterium]